MPLADQNLALADVAKQLDALIGEKYVLKDPIEMAGFLTEPRDLWRGRAAFVVRPGTTEQVAAVVRLAHEHGLQIVPQGGNTGLVGGQIPDQSGRRIVRLSDVSTRCARSTRLPTR